MARVDKSLVQLARERLKQVNLDEDTYMSNPQDLRPPHARADTPFLIGADGYMYLNLDTFRERGDLVAGFDPEAPEKTLADQEQIRLNRELELAREKAQAQEAARLEAEKEAKLAAEEKVKAEEIAQANAMSLEKLQQESENRAAEDAKKIAALQAQLDALAKSKSSEPAEIEGDTEDVGKEKLVKKPVKKSAPKRKASVKAEEVGEQDPLAGFMDD